MRKVCYFGIYNPTHSRNRLNIKGLRENGVEVLECNTREQSFKKYWLLVRDFRKIQDQFEVIIVGFPGHPIMPLAWLLAKFYGKKIIFDAFISLYDSIIFDEKKYSPHSFQAFKYWLLDWLSAHMADRVVLEVNEYARYFQETFGISARKFRRVLVTCDNEVMYPRPKPDSDAFLVHFHGTFIPAQGVDYIVGAAKILTTDNIRFNIIGRLKDYQPVIETVKKENINNIVFHDFMPYEQLAEMIAKADICLGMFGNTPKAKRAGAFKIMEALAMKKPLITADTPAVREFLVDGENALFCNIADSDDLARKILELKNKPQLREAIAAKGYHDFLKFMTSKQIGEDILQIVNEVV